MKQNIKLIFSCDIFNETIMPSEFLPENLILLSGYGIEITHANKKIKPKCGEKILTSFGFIYIEPEEDAKNYKENFSAHYDDSKNLSFTIDSELDPLFFLLNKNCLSLNNSSTGNNILFLRKNHEFM